MDSVFGFLNKILSNKEFVMVVAGIFFGVVIAFNILIVGDQQFSLLAYSFLHGKNYFTIFPNTYMDTVHWGGNYYWPLGPFPAFALMVPVYMFSVYGHIFSQGYLQMILVFVIFYLTHQISIKLKYSNLDSWYLAFAFVFSSVFFGLALNPWGWLFSQVVATTLLAWVFYEFLNKKRFTVIGMLLAFLFLTRPTASLSVVFFVLYILLTKSKNGFNKLRELVKLTLTFSSGVIIWLVYNYTRFGNALDQGYTKQILLFKPLIKARNYGLFSPIHVPGNLYYFLVAIPQPVFRDAMSHVLRFPFIQANPWGMGIFITSPYFIYLFLLKYKDKLSKLLIVTIIIIAIPIMFYYGIGYWQFGYRYSLDFLPLLFLLLIINYKKQKRALTNKFKLTILLSSILNLYLIMGMMF